MNRKRFIIKVGEECSYDWTEHRQREWIRPIKEFFLSYYPDIKNNLSWVTNGDDGTQYCVKEDFSGFSIVIDGRRVRDLIEKKGYILLSREDVMYFHSLEKILK